MSLIAALVLMVLFYAEGRIEGPYDADRANENLPVGHSESVTWRIAAACILSVVAVLLCKLTLWAVLPLLGVCYGANAPAIRLGYNRNRKPPHSDFYLSARGYDSVMLSHYTGFHGEALVIAHKTKYHGNVGGYADKNHKAGKAMYRIEVGTLALSMLVLLLITIL